VVPELTSIGRFDLELDETNPLVVVDRALVKHACPWRAIRLVGHIAERNQQVRPFPDVSPQRRRW
jgi:hypothetical protein